MNKTAILANSFRSSLPQGGLRASVGKPVAEMAAMATKGSPISLFQSLARGRAFLTFARRVTA